MQECAADEGAARASVCAEGDVRACPSCAAECEAADEYCRVCGARVRRLGARRARGGGVSREGGDPERGLRKREAPRLRPPERLRALY